MLELEPMDFWHATRQLKPPIICIPTNKTLTSGCETITIKGPQGPERILSNFSKLVMGKGLAKDAKQRFTGIDKVFANMIMAKPDDMIYPVYLKELTAYLIAFTTKLDWRKSSPIESIQQSAEALVGFADQTGLFPILLPRVGCGNGNLTWINQVQPLLRDIFDDRFLIVTPPNIGVVAPIHMQRLAAKQ
jgi:hypothetical protein